MQAKDFNRKRRGFSVAEMLVALAIAAALVGITYPLITGGSAAGQMNQAVAQANALNSAKQAYSYRVPGATTAFAGASTDAAKYALISPYIPYAPAALTGTGGFVPSGFTFSIGSLNTKVSITGAPSGLTAPGTNY